MLWNREMLTGCYIPISSELALDNGDSVTELSFVMDPCHPFFEADTRSQVIAPLIACASGPLGTNAQYFFALEQELKNYGMQDARYGGIGQVGSPTDPGAGGGEPNAGDEPPLAI